MKKIFTTLLLITITSFGMLGVVNAQSPSYFGDVIAYNPYQTVCSTGGQGSTSQSTICANANQPTNNPVGVKILNVVKLLDLAIGIVAVVMIVIGGIRFTLSGGDPQNVSGARNTIIYAVVGLIVAIIAQLILGLVINNLK